MSIFSYFLMSQKAILNYNEPLEEENRYTNRMKVFDGVFFLKKLDFAYYKKTMESYIEDT